MNHPRGRPKGRPFLYPGVFAADSMTGRPAGATLPPAGNRGSPEPSAGGILRGKKCRHLSGISRGASPGATMRLSARKGKKYLRFYAGFSLRPKRRRKKKRGARLLFPASRRNARMKAPGRGFFLTKKAADSATRRPARKTALSPRRTRTVPACPVWPT